MTRKSELAAAIGCPYKRFRTELRAMEVKLGPKQFFTGRNQYLTDTEVTLIREHFRTLTTTPPASALVAPHPQA